MAVLAMAVAGCSSKASTTSASTSTSTTAGSTSTTYPAGKEQLCAARDQLKVSVTALAKPSLLVGGAAAIKSAVDQVQTDADAVKAAAKQDYQPQVNTLETSIQDLRTSVGNLGAGSVTNNLQASGRRHRARWERPPKPCLPNSRRPAGPEAITAPMVDGATAFRSPPPVG